MTQTWYHKNSAGNHQGLVIDESTGANIAVTYDPRHAPLCAAAPELLAALDEFMWLADEYAHGHNEASRKLSANIAQARAAIRKARGE